MVGALPRRLVTQNCPLSKLPSLGNVDGGFPPAPNSPGSGKTAKAKVCPRCGERGAGPYLKRVGRNQFGLYFEHSVTENGVRRIKWHYIRKGSASKRRREELLRLIASEGWRGTGYHARVLKVSERTIRRDVLALRSSGLLIHRSYGGYMADPAGAILKENPWLAW
jgi:hypothetical protein